MIQGVPKKEQTRPTKEADSIQEGEHGTHESGMGAQSWGPTGSSQVPALRYSNPKSPGMDTRRHCTDPLQGLAAPAGWDCCQQTGVRPFSAVSAAQSRLTFQCSSQPILDNSSSRGLRKADGRTEAVIAWLLPLPNLTSFLPFDRGSSWARLNKHLHIKPSQSLLPWKPNLQPPTSLKKLPVGLFSLKYKEHE